MNLSAISRTIARFLLDIACIIIALVFSAWIVQNAHPSSDDSRFIREAINSVYQTIAITTILVSLVILAFLGTFRTMMIPAVTIPVCLTAAFIALAAFDYSVNLITQLALVLSIGLVVDDAIVVLENIYRRIEKGEEPLLAAYRG